MPFPIMPNQRTEKTPQSLIQPMSVSIDMLNYMGDNTGLLKNTYHPNDIDDNEADIIYNIWLHKDKELSQANRYMGEEEDIYDVPDGVSSQDLISLKARGLVEGSDSKVRFTIKAKEIIKNMILFGEDSSFKGESHPKYSDIKKRMHDNMHKSSKRRGS